MSKTSLSVMAWRNLWRNRRRTLLTLSSIVFGVFLAVLFTGMQDRNWADTINLAARLGHGHVTLQHPQMLDAPKLTLSIRQTETLVEKALAQSHVVRAVPRISGQVMLATAGESFGAAFLAIDPATEDETTLSVLAALSKGKPLESPRDRGILLGERLAANLGAKLGHRIVYTTTDAHGQIVSGLARLSGLIRTGAPSVDRRLCILPIDAVREVLDYAPDEATQIAVFVDDQRRSRRVARELQRLVSKDVAVYAWSEINPELAGFIAMKVGGARFMEMLIAVLVAAGIFNTLFVSVMERLREFGILLAIGFSPSQLFRLVMLESLWLGLVGLAGATVVTVGPYLYLSRTGIDWSNVLGQGNTEVAGVALPTTIHIGIYPESALIIAVAALVATLLSGLYPAWRAGRVEPVETIQLV